ncbi:MAG TPA: RNA methyltransferase [Anaerolineaceae bacterium]
MITSPANPRIKWIRKLRERKEREAEGVFFAEGLRIVLEASQEGADIDFLVISRELLRSNHGLALVSKLEGNGVPILEVDAAVFRLISQKDGPQGIGAVIRQKWESLEKVTCAPGDLWIALDSIQDPGNLGTILRTGDAVGTKGVILLDQSTDPYDPGTVRGSMGALFTQKIAKASLADFRAWKLRNNVHVIGTSGSSTKDYHGFPYPDPMVLLMGSERLGLLEQHYQICDDVVSIPMVGKSDSLNLAIATAVILYEIFNAKRAHTEGREM